ncbi:MAG: preprotein translocase subunit YajC [Clostridium sp.]
MGIVLQLIPLVLVFGVFYFMLIVPEKKRKKNYEAMLEGLSLNDEIMTRGGLVGKIVAMEGDNFILQTGPDRVKIKMVKSAIANKVYNEEQ